MSYKTEYIDDVIDAIESDLGAYTEEIEKTAYSVILIFDNPKGYSEDDFEDAALDLIDTRFEPEGSIIAREIDGDFVSLTINW
tara:strand:- start:2906 stop:3154 length:249 start_codon:yes stop_codon:yes gene_type:complete